MSLPKHDLELLEQFKKRYAKSGTLMAGAVYEARWSVSEVRDWWNDLFQYNYGIAWMTDPRCVGAEAGVHTVALGPSGHTVHADGRRDRESGLNCASDTERARALGAARVLFDEGEGGLRALTPKIGWNLLCGCEAARVDLLLGWVLKAGDAPAGFDVVAGPERTVFGLRLSQVTRDPGWVRVDLSPAAIKAAIQQVTSRPGAPKGKPKLELLVGGEVMATGAGAEAGAASFEPTEIDLAKLLRGFEESRADSFDPPLTFESLARDGDALRLIVDGDAVSVPWGGWAGLRDVEAQLMGALRQYIHQRSS